MTIPDTILRAAEILEGTGLALVEREYGGIGKRLEFGGRIASAAGDQPCCVELIGDGGQ
jgi:hypothetical protein